MPHWREPRSDKHAFDGVIGALIVIVLFGFAATLLVAIAQT